MISVVIPLFNKKLTILRALNSVFIQTTQPVEIIVVNDGSTDGSEQIVASLDHPLVKLIHQKNAGVSAARNKGIEEAKEEWIAFLDADDEWKPDFLKTIEFLSTAYPQCSVLSTAYLIQNNNGKREKIVLNKIPFSGDNGILTNYFEVASCSNPPICSSSVVVKKDAIIAIGGYPVGIRSGEDLLTWARLAVKYKIAYSLIASSIFIPDTSTIRIPEIPDIVAVEFQNLAEENSKYRIEKYISFWHKMRARNFLELGQKKNALNEIYFSIKNNSLTKAWYFLPFVFFGAGLFKMILRRGFKLLSKKVKK
jgi:glycosyltransferase involved in cell wall biosynthesis